MLDQAGIDFFEEARDGSDDGGTDFEKSLSDGRKWIAGDLSIADFALATTFRLRKAADMPLQTRPRVEAWMQRMEQRPSWQKAIGEIPG